MRFIDLAHDGGCSKKAPALEIRGLLEAIGNTPAGALFRDMSKELPDCGVYVDGNATFLSSIDVVLPMTLAAHDFGKITVLHVLSDLYASGGLPKFALCLLGLPTGMSAAAPEAVSALTGAIEQLSTEGAVLIGGHTMTDQADFYMGFAAFGGLINGGGFRRRQSRIGDRLIMTKALGTSVAVGRWKFDDATEADHDDVLQGMLQSNRAAAELLSGLPVSSCTDITGYGFLGHLYNIMYASEISCRVFASKVPIYESVRAISAPTLSAQAMHNIEYALPHLKIKAAMGPLREALFFDSQVSGGLLISVPADLADATVNGLAERGVPASVVGDVCAGPPGGIMIVD